MVTPRIKTIYYWLLLAHFFREIGVDALHALHGVDAVMLFMLFMVSMVLMQATQTVEKIGARIARASGLEGCDWEFLVVQDESMNAFALPGGKVTL